MKEHILRLTFTTALLFSAVVPLSSADEAGSASDGTGHLARYKDGIPGDAAIEAASKLDIAIPIMVREWHIWWGTPYGKVGNMHQWQHWKGERKFKQFNPDRTIETAVPGKPWRRYLNSIGYPLLGPYDSNQRDIIRWQLETAKNSGAECLHLHLWPALWDKGVDMTPLPIADKAFEEAAKLNFPIAIHDEIMFRKPNITKAQTLESSIQRTSAILKRYGKHKGFYRIDDMPVYYMQIYNNWMSAENLQRYLSAVEKEVGAVYWIIEGASDESYLKIPEIKALCPTHMGLFLHVPPYGAGPHPWERLTKEMTAKIAQIRAAGKKVGINLKPRFNHTNDRGTAEKPKIIDGQDGMFFVKVLAHAKSLKPDFIIVAQWNDFEEGGQIEPAWDFDGFNGDPYRYTRILAAAQSKTFQPAPLPDRHELDRRIRPKLFDSIAQGDMGPMLEDVKLAENTLSWTISKENRPIKEIRLSQKDLKIWEPTAIEFKGGGQLTLANFAGLSSDGMLEENQKMRFYLTGFEEKKPSDFWIGIHARLPNNTNLTIAYAGLGDNIRVDSRWEKRSTGVDEAITQTLPDKSAIYWMPLYGAKFSGREGDLTLRLTGKNEESKVMKVMLWHPDSGQAISGASGSSLQLPEGYDPTKPLVLTAYDEVGNPGIPSLIFSPGRE